MKENSSDFAKNVKIISKIKKLADILKYLDKIKELIYNDYV